MWAKLKYLSFIRGHLIWHQDCNWECSSLRSDWEYSCTVNTQTCLKPSMAPYMMLDVWVMMYSSRRHRASFLTRPETVIIFSSFYRTRVRSLSTLVTSSLTDSLAHSLLFSKIDWCNHGVQRYRLKTFWCCYCCWCQWWGSCWQQFVADFEADVWSKS